MEFSFQIAIVILFMVSIGLLLYISFYLQRSSRRSLLSLTEQMKELLHPLSDKIAKEFYENRHELNKNFYSTRKENGENLRLFQDSLLKRLNESLDIQHRQYENIVKNLNKLIVMNEERMEKINTTVAQNLEKIQKDNAEKLEKMRVTVDEKLHKTLEDRLGSTFKIVSERLELVHKGLGEMQQLATGIGDLKRVLTNVKTRGVMGEIQLENILQEMFAPEQYGKNVKVDPDKNYFVEFALRLPGQDNKQVWIPIDSKFPIEDYQELLNFSGTNRDDFVTLQNLFARKIVSFAKDIKEKYIHPPFTTNFAIMFLPVEGIYAEVLRNQQLFEKLRKDYGVVPTGPTTLAAFLSSLQMGFRTLAIEKRSSEVWELLSAVKTEFRKFGGVLDKTKKKLQEASNVIDKAGVRTRVIERKLKDVEILPEKEKNNILKD